MDKVSRGRRWAVPTQKAGPSWVDTEGPVPGRIWVSESSGVVSNLEAPALGVESTPELLVAPGTILKEEPQATEWFLLSQRPKPLRVSNGKGGKTEARGWA